VCEGATTLAHRTPKRNYACFQATLKLVPPLRPDVCAFSVDPETMSILSGLKLPIGCPFTSVEVKPTVPKFVNGRTPPELDGASAIASADASLARGSFCVVVNP
jgi:hypothetical protein